ncbi:FAD-dependent oxidoreductase [Speluncibacter jeojiensis]|uniref:ferredoxin--NADP(+) reductase n=1 Tax=Speluncibacter jeojiensis TaxID=2710754 RepID=A0A9X4LX34_9ACTN|nr:FAD-dependent oxidoreductase [Corynebacteriales bacterium D3-21]
MPHVVTQSCCSDGSCVYACPVNCIHPTPDEPDFLTAEMLHVDPVACVDCGACVTACPVGAILPHGKLSEEQLPFLEINADFYKQPRERPLLAPMIESTTARADLGGLRVAVVGSGPAGMYAADEILRQAGAQVNVFDRLPAPYGLVRAGVAPDHQHTKQVTDLYDKVSREPGFQFFLKVEVGDVAAGADVSHEELLAHHHAVIYAVGASSDRRLDVPGADLPGIASATEFVGWYNGHPDHAHRTFDLSHRRVVIVGNGNVALDVARILASDPDRLAGTDISGAALAALRGSKVEEIVVVGRRGAAQSAFTLPELTGLVAGTDYRVVVDRDGEIISSQEEHRLHEGGLGHAADHKLAVLGQLPSASDDAVAGGKRIVLRYLLSPKGFDGSDRVEAAEFASGAFTADGIDYADEPVRIETGLVLTSVGYHGRRVADLPFDPATGTVPNDGGKVTDSPGAYVTGWIKRGPSGFIGTNKSCAHDTVEQLLADVNAGPGRTVGTQAELTALVRRRRPDMVDREGWAALDAAERRAGATQGRVRDKIIDADEAVRTALAVAPPAPERRFTLRRKSSVR